MHILLSNSLAGPGRKVKQEQEEISRNYVQAFIPGSDTSLLSRVRPTMQFGRSIANFPLTSLPPSLPPRCGWSLSFLSFNKWDFIPRASHSHSRIK